MCAFRMALSDEVTEHCLCLDEEDPSDAINTVFGDAVSLEPGTPEEGDVASVDATDREYPDPALSADHFIIDDTLSADDPADSAMHDVLLFNPLPSEPERATVVFPASIPKKPLYTSKEHASTLRLRVPS